MRACSNCCLRNGNKPGFVWILPILKNTVFQHVLKWQLVSWNCYSIDVHLWHNAYFARRQGCTWNNALSSPNMCNWNCSSTFSWNGHHSSNVFRPCKTMQEHRGPKTVYAIGCAETSETMYVKQHCRWIRLPEKDWNQKMRRMSKRFHKKEK